MSEAKGAMKAVGAALKAEKYDEVVHQAQKLLVLDPKSYKGWVMQQHCAQYLVSLN